MTETDFCHLALTLSSLRQGSLSEVIDKERMLQRDNHGSTFSNELYNLSNLIY